MLSSSDLKYLLTGKNIDVFARVERDAVLVTLASSKDDLEIGLQTLYLLLTEPQLEKSKFKIWKENEQQKILKQSYHIESRHWQRFSEVISYGDQRFTSLTQKDLDNLTFSKVQNQLDALIQFPLEVAIVGDIKLEKAKELSQLYFGSLSYRAKIDYKDDLRKIRKLKNEAGSYTNFR